MAAINRIKIGICATIVAALAANVFVIPAQLTDDAAMEAAMKDYQAGITLGRTKDPAQLKNAIELVRKALAVFEKLKAYEEIGSSYLVLGHFYGRLEDKTEAIRQMENGLAAFETGKIISGQAMVLNDIGERYLLFNGEPAKARDHLLRAWDLIQKEAYKSLDLTILDNLGYAYVKLTDRKNAEFFLQKAIDISLTRGNEEIVEALKSYGTAQIELETPSTARTYFELALRRSREAGLKEEEADVLNSYGELYLFNLNDRATAFGYFNDALKVLQTVDEPHTLTLTLNNLGMCYYQTFEFQKALDHYERAIGIAVKSGDQRSQATLMQNKAVVYESLNDRKQATELLEKVRALGHELGDRSAEASAVFSLSNLADEAGELKQAIKLSTEAINLVTDLPNVRRFLTEILISRGILYLKAGEIDGALDIFNTTLTVASERNYQSAEAKSTNNIGKIYELKGDLTKALEFYNSSLLISRAIDDKYSEARTLENLMVSWSKLGNTRFAIFFGKSSVNVYQQLRKNLSNLTREHQKSFMGNIEDTYRTLSDLLIKTGRIAEAEQVLTMLKEEELMGYVRREDDVAKQMLATMAISDEERLAITRYEALAGQITAVGKEFADLEVERKQFPAGQFPKKAQWVKLKLQIDDAKLAFEKFLQDLKLKFGQNDTRVAMVDSSLKNTLERLKADQVAAVSTIVGKDTLNIIVTTSKTQRAHTIKKSAEEINALVAKFRTALTSPQYDPRPLGQQLYDILVKPIEGDLAGIKANTILWSLDGTLRYVPPAALWDKTNGYLAERFANVLVNLASRDNIALPAADGKNLSVLGVGVSKPTEGFSALTAVPDELDCIVTDKTAGTLSAKPQCSYGVLAGRKLLDEKFTLTNFEDEIGRYPIIHIASHFKLTPGDDKNSFLLLGGGTDRRFTVEKLRSEPLADIELIVLSACNTATPGGAGADGVEVEGFGVIAQKDGGAHSVLATLWSVADFSTKDFMVEFYRLYGKEGVSKADAMRRAQLRLMYGKYSADEAQKHRADDFVQAVDKTLPPFKTDPNAPFAHPFYWSPFTLIGNWR